MPLLSGDLSFQRSAVMADVPEGGGPPNGQVVPDGAHNAIFPDIAEEARVVGQVLIRQVHTMCGNTDTDPLLRANVILAERPDDPNVAITMLTTGDPYARRSDIVKHIGAMRAPSVDMNGYLLHDHLATMRVIQIFQRPGATPPPPMATLLLVANDGLPTEYSQLVRVLDSGTPEIRTFSEIVAGSLVDYQAQVVQLELMQELAYTFPGSPPSRLFTRASGKTRIRETFFTATDSFHGAMELTAPATASDTWLQVDSIYSQIVPNTRSEAAVLNQRPGGTRSIVLAESPRRVEVSAAPHARRIPIDDNNLSRTYVSQLQPPPEPRTISVNFWVLGQRYTLEDDGNGALTGQGGTGMIDYATGSLSIQLAAIPDVRTWITMHWGERTAYTNRSSQGAAVRKPEYCWRLEHAGVVPGSLSIDYTSGGVLRTVTDNGSGQLSGAATGSIDYPSGLLLLRPQYMPDPGAEFDIDYQTDTLTTELISLPTPDSNGYVQITLAAVPVAGSLELGWATHRYVSTSAGDLVYYTQDKPPATSPPPGTETTVTAEPQPESFPPYVPHDINGSWTRYMPNAGRDALASDY